MVQDGATAECRSLALVHERLLTKARYGFEISNLPHGRPVVDVHAVTARLLEVVHESTLVAELVMYYSYRCAEKRAEVLSCYQIKA